VRYRRYYSQRNPDGSRNVTSVGPIGAYLIDAARIIGPMIAATVAISAVVLGTVVVLIVDGPMRLKSEYRHTTWPPPVIARMWRWGTKRLR